MKPTPLRDLRPQRRLSPDKFSALNGKNPIGSAPAMGFFIGPKTCYSLQARLTPKPRVVK